jgi:selenocysteine lyase/cysteine desulfurase
VEECREIAARMIGLQTNEVSFCSCSSEAYNLLASALDLKPGDEVLVTDERAIAYHSITPLDEYIAAQRKNEEEANNA